MHNPNAKKEISSLLVFVPIMALALYLVYLVVSVPFNIGRSHGLAQAPFRDPDTGNDAADEVFDHRRLVQPSEELITQGARIYAQQCASCHGAGGHGDGAAGRALAVRPRSFHDGDFASWSLGASTLQMYEAIEQGVGGNMPAFPQLNPRQKYAVVHYIHDAFMGDLDVPEDSPEALASLPEPSAGVQVNIDSYQQQRIPVRMALERMAQPAPAAQPAPREPLPPDTVRGLGAALYMNNCASCHGASGQGVVPERLNRTSLPQLRQLSQGPALRKPGATWIDDFDEFRRIVTEGMPGSVKPGFPALTREELRALHDHTLSLRQD